MHLLKPPINSPFVRSFVQSITIKLGPSVCLVYVLSLSYILSSTKRFNVCTMFGVWQNLCNLGTNTDDLNTGDEQ